MGRPAGAPSSPPLQNRQAGERSAPWSLGLVGIVRTVLAATAGACGIGVAGGRSGRLLHVVAGRPRSASGGREPPRCHAAAESVCRTTLGQTQLAEGRRSALFSPQTLGAKLRVSTDTEGKRIGQRSDSKSDAQQWVWGSNPQPSASFFPRNTVKDASSAWEAANMRRAGFIRRSPSQAPAWAGGRRTLRRKSAPTGRSQACPR